MPNTNTVTTRLLPHLRNGGIKIRIRHSRFISTARGPMFLPMTAGNQEDCSSSLLPHGGETTVDLLFPDGHSYTGAAVCSTSDRFNRLEGIRIATERALKQRKALKELERFSKEGSSWERELVGSYDTGNAV